MATRKDNTRAAASKASGTKAPRGLVAAPAIEPPAVTLTASPEQMQAARELIAQATASAPPPVIVSPVSPTLSAILARWDAAQPVYQAAASAEAESESDDARKALTDAEAPMESAYADLLAYRPRNAAELAEKARRIKADRWNDAEALEALLEDILAAGDRPDPDARLAVMEAECARLLSDSKTLPEAEGDAAFQRAIALDREVMVTPCHGLTGALAKLRRIADPEIGIFNAGMGDHMPTAMAQALAALEGAAPPVEPSPDWAALRADFETAYAALLAIPRTERDTPAADALREHVQALYTRAETSPAFTPADIEVKHDVISSNFGDIGQAWDAVLPDIRRLAPSPSATAAAEADRQFVLWSAEVDRLHAAADAHPDKSDNGEAERLYAEATRIASLILSTPCAGPVGAREKLRAVLCDTIGLRAGSTSPLFQTATEQAFAALAAPHGPDFAADPASLGKWAQLVANYYAARIAWEAHPLDESVDDDPEEARLCGLVGEAERALFAHPAPNAAALCLKLLFHSDAVATGRAGGVNPKWLAKLEQQAAAGQWPAITELSALRDALRLGIIHTEGE